jgi:hypothetical protein
MVKMMGEHSFQHMPTENRVDVRVNPFSKFNFQFVEKRRLTAKNLTVIIRDFHKLKEEDCNVLFRLCLQNLILFFPLYQFFMDKFSKEKFEELNPDMVVGPSNKYFQASDVDFEEFEQEIKALIAQLISLL